MPAESLYYQAEKRSECHKRGQSDLLTSSPFMKVTANKAVQGKLKLTGTNLEKEMAKTSTEKSCLFVLLWIQCPGEKGGHTSGATFICHLCLENMQNITIFAKKILLKRVSIVLYYVNKMALSFSIINFHK